MLACLVVDDNVDAKERHSQSLSQRPGQLPNNIIVGWLGHTLYIISLQRWEQEEKHFKYAETLLAITSIKIKTCPLN